MKRIDKNKETDLFVMENYGKKPVFSSFLPGITGEHGIPTWCYYVNRGQAVASFGMQDKDHAIMEFFPAHQSYQNVKRTGFRTFIKRDGVYLEPFSREEIPHRMGIAMNHLTLEEEDNENKIVTQVTYFTLPGETEGALVRKLTVCNISDKKVELEVLDGMPALIPYGVDMENMKEMGQTVKAWMQVVLQDGIPLFKARASIKDTATVTMVEGANFSVGSLPDGTLLKPVVDAQAVFGYDSSLGRAVGFETRGLEDLISGHQIMQNEIPCSFYGSRAVLAEGETLTIYQMIGQTEKMDEAAAFIKGHRLDAAYYERKLQEADGLTEELCKAIGTKTADENFDSYCRYTYLDNLLRGGCPVQLGKHTIFYLYSRKHGDLERDYNFFSMLPQYYSQGNGNYRDVNQNRRCDSFFAPMTGSKNIETFYNLMQLDGYNPLGIEKVTYTITEGEYAERLREPFTPGQLYRMLEQEGPKDKAERDELFGSLMDSAKETVNGNFLEGYWTDHWTYNLDLVEEYLGVFPECEEELLFRKKFVWYVCAVKVNKRAARYEKTPVGIRQYHALDEEHTRTEGEKLVYAANEPEIPVQASLMEKLVLLCALKCATLDPYGMGIEMEGGKPGWYDALNGLPGLLGSSMNETYELARLIDAVNGYLKKYRKDVSFLNECADFLVQMQNILKQEMLRTEAAGQDGMFDYWNRSNDAKESYRDRIFAGVEGSRRTLSSEFLIDLLNGCEQLVRRGMERAEARTEGVCPSYFYYSVTQYEEKEDGIHPLDFEVQDVPLFLEGPVRRFKTALPLAKKKELYQSVKKSDLYDEKLSMYKVNASLNEASYELGRTKAFTPGWLENESIWLHMEYKYLLELLKSGLYQEFFEDFHKAAIPFLDADVYGRSIYENSSFLVSSANPEESLHGRGFVARLSGSTAEFLQMWKIMMFGQNPFTMRDGELCFSLEPAIPSYLTKAGETVEATLLGSIKTVYRISEQKDYIPGGYEIAEILLEYKNGNLVRTNGAIVGRLAEDIRNGRIRRIEASLA